MGVRSVTPPNGDGGGLTTKQISNFDYNLVIEAANLNFKDFTLHDMTDTVLSVTQCIYSSGEGCNTSKFKISDVKGENGKGTQVKNGVAVLQWSSAAPGTNIEIKNIDVKLNNGTEVGATSATMLKILQALHVQDLRVRRVATQGFASLRLGRELFFQGEPSC